MFLAEGVCRTPSGEVVVKFRINTHKTEAAHPLSPTISAADNVPYPLLTSYGASCKQRETVNWKLALFCRWRNKFLNRNNFLKVTSWGVTRDEGFFLRFLFLYKTCSKIIYGNISMQEILNYLNLTFPPPFIFFLEGEDGGN